MKASRKRALRRTLARRLWFVVRELVVDVLRESSFCLPLEVLEYGGAAKVIEADLVLRDLRILIFVRSEYLHGWNLQRAAARLEYSIAEKRDLSRIVTADVAELKARRKQGWKVFKVWDRDLIADLPRELEPILLEIRARSDGKGDPPGAPPAAEAEPQETEGEAGAQ